MKKRLIIGLSSILLVCLVSGLIVTKSLLDIVDDLYELDRKEAVSELYTDLIYRIQTIQEEMFRHQTGAGLQRGLVFDTLDDIDADASLILLSLKEDGKEFEEVKVFVDGYTGKIREFLDREGNGGSALSEREITDSGQVTLALLREVLKESKKRFLEVRGKGKEDIRRGGYLVIITFTTTAILLCVITGAMIKGIVGPIKSLTKGVNVIAEGDFTKKVEVRQGGEIGVLADSFNRMADSLFERDLELKKMNETLEEKVRQRTAELNRANEVLKEQYRDILEAEKVKAEFLANMSHELRTPLNGIIGFAKVIMQGIDGPVNERQAADLEIIHRSGQHLLEMINDVLDISKIESGKMELNREIFSLKEVISDTVSTQRRFAEEKGIILSEKISPEVGNIHADKLRIRQILLNLLSNAVKFTESGTVTVRAGIEDGEVEISVSDTGIGIRKEDIPKVFEQFKQIDSTSTRKHGGSGLGMAITKDLVEMHGGRIWLESEYKEGTTFYVRLPTGDAGKGKRSVLH